MDEWSRRVRALKRQYIARRERGHRDLKTWFDRVRASREISPEQMSARLGVTPEGLREIEAGFGFCGTDLRDRIEGEFVLTMDELSDLERILGDIYC